MMNYLAVRSDLHGEDITADTSICDVRMGKAL